MKLGLIGAGNMATAIVKGILSASLYAPSDIWMSDADPEKRREKEKLGVHTTDDNRKLTEISDICIFAVKPQVLPQVLADISDAMSEDKLFISIAAGIKTDKIRALSGKENLKIVRVMPNTPLMVGAGMSALSATRSVTEKEKSAAEEIFSAAGRAVWLPEEQFDTVTAASGSGPAYIYMMIEAMAEMAEENGIPWEKACLLCAQTVLGSAKMVLETGIHPGELREMVCSPGGTTIEAVKRLYAEHFPDTVKEAMRDCKARSEELGK